MRLEDFPDPCAHCSRDMPASRGANAIFCSKACKEAARAAPALAARSGLVCPMCGATFDALKSTKIFCSRLCGLRAWRAYHKAKRPALPSKSCAECAEAFVPSLYSKVAHKFCGYRCQRLAMARRALHRRRARRVMETRTCPECGARFEASASKAKVFCSGKCRDRAGARRRACVT